MDWVYIVLIVIAFFAFAVGAKAASPNYYKLKVGRLHIMQVDGEACLFAQLEKPLSDIANEEYVVLKVEQNGYLAKDDHSQK